MENKEVKTKEISYDELRKVAVEQQNQMQKMMQEIHFLRNQQGMARMQFLFKVLELSTHFDSEFVTECASQIKEIMTVVDLPSEEPSAQEVK